MSLYCESIGTGPDLVLVHGWGWHGGVWSSLAQQFATRFRVWMPDLPGHGASREAVPAGIDGWLQAIKKCTPASATWVGWSLGGLIALAATRASFATRLVLLATTPRFIQDTDWLCAWSADEFGRFRDDVESDATKALERFAGLHLGAADSSRAQLRDLRVMLSSRGLPQSQALREGLEILQRVDCRTILSDLHLPVLVVHGDNDRIVFAGAGERMALALPDARFLSIAGAGHALPLFYADDLVSVIGEFAGG